MRFYIFLLIVFSIISCSGEGANNSDSSALDYSNEQLWFELSSDVDKSVDVFYILPTCIWDWEDEEGNISHYADPFNESQREAMQGSYELARDIFANSSCNFFAPYYQQISLESWIEGDSVVSSRFPFTMNDIQAAFDYFLENKNNNRPFILAGFSQGGKGVVELLKTISQEEYNRMIAAYVIGYRVASDELEEYSTIQQATNSSDIGVVVNYNSVATIDAICPVLSPSSICINPISWTTATTPAVLNDSVTVSVNNQYNVLLVEGFDSELYYEPILSNIFAQGNYHLQELYFYQENLTSNVIERINNYFNK